MASDKAPDFFVVSKGEVNAPHDTEYLKAEKSRFGDAPRCDACGSFVGMRPWLPPFRAELTLHGDEWGDFAFFSDSDFLITERVAALFTASGLTGLSGFEPVEIVSTKGPDRNPPVYLHVVVARGGAAIDEGKSSLDRSEPVSCEVCRSAGLDAIHGLALRPKSWTGEDVFFARGLPGTVIAAAQFRQLVEQNHLTNVRLVPTEAYEWDSMAPIVSSR